MSRAGGAGGPAPAAVSGGMRTIILKDGRVFKGNVVIDGKEAVDLVWSDRGAQGHEVNMQAHIPREAIESEEDAPAV